jgi:hypothetical protein
MGLNRKRAKRQAFPPGPKEISPALRPDHPLVGEKCTLGNTAHSYQNRPYGNKFLARRKALCHFNVVIEPPTLMDKTPSRLSAFWLFLPGLLFFISVTLLADPFAELESEVTREKAAPAADDSGDQMEGVSGEEMTDTGEAPPPSTDSSAPSNIEWADSPDGRASIALLRRAEGTVLLLSPDSIRRERITEGHIIYEQDIILTQSRSSATLEVVDGSRIVLASRARLEARSSEQFFQQEGIAYFDVSRRTGETRFAVDTKFAMIGVKGTEFIINANPFTGRVALNEGEIEIVNPNDEEYAITERKPLSYEDWANQRMQGFAEYKKKIVEEFTEYKKSFTLQPGKRLIFNGNRVQQDDMENEDKTLFERFRQLR